jgi:hypothetical protein
MISELVVNVPEPFIRVHRLTLRLIAEEHHDIAASRRESLPKPSDKLLALIGVVRLQCFAWGSSGDQERTEERPFESRSMIFAGHSQCKYVRPRAPEV